MARSLRPLLAFLPAMAVVATGGAALAQSQADVIIANPSLVAVGEALSLARRTRRIIRQNVAWSIGYNLVMLPLALTAQLTPWVAALGMSISSLLVVGNALRLLRGGPASLARPARA